MEITKKERDYLILIKELSGEFPPRVSDVARASGVKEPTAYEALKNMERKGLIKIRRGVVVLTELGSLTYYKIIKAHRVLELLFVKHGADPDEACRECSNIDYVVEPSLIEKVYASLGAPSFCPHGKPIEVSERWAG